jgi:hypothetical protein
VFRQRIRAHDSGAAFVAKVVLTLLGLGLIWYGLMVALLALKTSPSLVNDISGYRTAYNYFAGLQTGDITPRVRVIAGLGGFAAFILFGFLAWKLLPRPYLTRSKLLLKEEPRGALVVEPRVFERAAEAAAREHPAVSDTAGRYEVDGLGVNVRVGRTDLVETLRDIQRRVLDALERHNLPKLPVSVTLTGFEGRPRRELK